MHICVKRPSTGLRSLLLTPVLCCTFLGCDGRVHAWIAARAPLVPHTTIEATRGAAVRVALDRAERATATTRRHAARPRSSCRSPLPDTPVTVTSTVAFHGKRADGTFDRWRVTSEWQRDADGDVALTRRVHTRLPDGREAERAYAARVIDGRSFAAIDDRFAETTEEPAVGQATRGAAFVDVDELLSTLVWDGAWRTRGVPLCGERVDRGLPDVEAASVRWRFDGRDGWLRYREGLRRLTVVFEEHIRTGADDVITPTTLWPIDADSSYADVDAFAEVGRLAGWWTDPPETTSLPRSTAPSPPP